MERLQDLPEMALDDEGCWDLLLISSKIWVVKYFGLISLHVMLIFLEQFFLIRGSACWNFLIEISQIYSGFFTGFLWISCFVELGLYTEVESVILCEETRLNRKCLRSSINQNVASITKAKMCHLGGFRNGAKRKDVVTDDVSKTPTKCFHQCTHFFNLSLLLSIRVGYG